MGRRNKMIRKIINYFKKEEKSYTVRRIDDYNTEVTNSNGFTFIVKTLSPKGQARLEQSKRNLVMLLG